MKILPLTLLGFSLSIGTVFSQETEGPQTPPAVNAPPAPNSGATEETSLDFMQRSSAILATIRDNERHIDPFGLPMDPTNAVDNLAMSDEFEDAAESTVLNASAFKTALENLPISGIYPQKEMVVIGARSFKKGEQFGMKLEELTIRLRVEGIRGSSIYFKDLDTQEVAAFDFNPTPAEFEPIYRNSKQPRGPGIVPMEELFIVN